MTMPALTMLDSGLGGLSILLAVKKQQPSLSIRYLADSHHAPYGDKSNDFIHGRSRQLVQWLSSGAANAIMVVACNTITVHAIQQLRAEFPAMMFVGVEPGLKPASLLSRNKKIALLATRATLASNYVQEKIRHYQQQYDILPVAALGLVDEIEQHHGQYGVDDFFSPRLEQLLAGYLAQVKDFGADVLVLGCTHYSFLKPLINRALPAMTIVDTSDAVASRALSLLPPPASTAGPTAAPATVSSVELFTTGDAKLMQQFVDHVAGFPPYHVKKISI